MIRYRSQVQGPVGHIYLKPEDEFYHKLSTEAFTWPISESFETEDDFLSLRLVLLISHDSAIQARSL